MEDTRQTLHTIASACSALREGLTTTMQGQHASNDVAQIHAQVAYHLHQAGKLAGMLADMLPAEEPKCSS